MAKLQNYKLGQEGVDVDTSPLVDSPYSLTKAQNAFYDVLGVVGGLRKRLGLTKVNSVAAAGTLSGGVSMPTASFVDTRPLIIAAQDGSSVEKWYASSDLYATSGVAQTAVGAWQDPTAYFSGGAGLCRMGVFLNGELFYASANYTSGTTSPTIRVYNGVDDREISKILPATTLGITGMFTANGQLFILTLDSGTTDADFVGRLFQMDRRNGNLTQIGNAMTTGHVPVSFAVHNGLIFVGTARTTTTDEAVVLRINPLDETTWTTDLSASADDYAITSLTSFQGLLYATTKNGGGATKGKILQRSIAGSWSTVDSTTANTGEYDGSVVFNNAIYASSRVYNSGATTAVIRKSTDGTTWSTVTNNASTAGFGLMFVVGLRIFSIFGTKLQHSTDGSSWTLTSHGSGGNADGALGVLFPALGIPAQLKATTVNDQLQTETTFNDPTTTGTGPGGSITFNIGGSSSGSGSGGGDAVIFSNASSLSDSQLRALSGSASELMAVGVPGKILVPLGFAMSANIETAISGNLTLSIRYQGASATIYNIVATPTTTTGFYLLQSTPASSSLLGTNVGSAGGTYGVDVRGAGLSLYAPTNTLSGGSITGRWQFTLIYMLLTVP